MEIDLAGVEAPVEAIRSQVCVIGAGIAGLTVTRKLALQGIDVVLLEAGGRDVEEGGQRQFAAAGLNGQAHEGTREGRFRVFGGSSLRWGGQLLAMSREEAAGWPIAWEEIAGFSAEAERLLGVDALPFDGHEFFDRVGASYPKLIVDVGEVKARVSKWMAFSRRNLASTLGRELLERSNVRVYLHAQAAEVLLARTGSRVEAVLARNVAGKPFRFEAEEFVIAAGTVETSRLLLASRSVAAEGVGNAKDQVGRNFHDHLTLPVATLRGQARERVLRELRPWVCGGTLRGGTAHSVKMEASAELRERLGLNAVLAHGTIDEPEGSGIAVVREMLTAVQRGEVRRVVGRQAMHVPRAAVEAVRLVWEAKVRGRRFVSKDAVVRLQLNAAQDAPSESRIRLGAGVDAMGVRQAEVDWRVTANEVATLRRFAGYLKERFDAAGLTGVEWLPEMFVEGAGLPGLEDARHAMGGACMGVDPLRSVVDAELTVHGVENLSVAGAATFPTGGAQLPTLTMMALALRLGERLAKRVRR